MAAPRDKDQGLKRLGGGRWQTRDARFTIEPQSGSWVVVDADQVDELGLPLVRGPYGALRDAKVAIDAARVAGPVESPLDARAERIRLRPPSGTERKRGKLAGRTPPAARPLPATSRPGEASPDASRSRGSRQRREPREPQEPPWVTELPPDERRRARRLIDRLVAAEAPDPEGIARRDVVGRVPGVAAFAVARAILALGPDASPAAVAAMLADGRDKELGVRWRLVDEDGRPIVVDLDRSPRSS